MRRTAANRQSLADKTWKESFPHDASLIEHEKKKQASQGRGNMLDISRYRHIGRRGTDETEQIKPARQQGWEEDGEEYEEEQQYQSPESREKLQDIIRRRREGRIEQGGGVKASIEDISLYEQQDMQRKEAMAENERMYQERLKHEREHNWEMIHENFKARITKARREKNQERFDSLVAEMKAEQKGFLETFKNTNRPRYKEMLDSRYKEIDRHFDELRAQRWKSRGITQTRKTFVEKAGPSHFRNKFAEAQRLAAEKTQHEQEDAKRVLLMERDIQLMQSQSQSVHNQQHQHQPPRAPNAETGSAAAADPNSRQNLVDRFRSNLNRARPQTAAGTHNSSMRDGADNDAAKGPYSVKGPNAFLKRMAETIVHPPCTACLKCGKWIITF